MLSISFFRKNRNNNDGLQCYCKVCQNKATKTYKHNKGLQQPFYENKDCSCYLGVHVAERILSVAFKDVKRMPYNHRGYDFICGKGFKIDVKSSCRRKPKYGSSLWHFTIKHNKEADYFLCIAFDSRQSLTPEHVWLIPGNVVNSKELFGILESKLDSWAKYERPIDNVIVSCETMRSLCQKSIHYQTPKQNV